ncbi:acetamidase/formamidase family protein [Deinococcus malanensis]|uniref:acetamidase/formamidase family protein n=1 Tax=Deinococcus malanensis TaxID=1706855 RepID=UPI0036354566
MTDHVLDASHIHTSWNRDLAPALRAQPGDRVTFDTLDASGGAVARRVASGELDAPEGLRALIEQDAYPALAGPRGHPLTGPVFVEGVMPGDALVIEILEVRAAAWGWTGCRPDGIGLLDAALGEEGLQPYTHFWDLREGTHASFGPGVRLPLSPFPGVVGVALAEPGDHATAPPPRRGQHGHPPAGRRQHPVPAGRG